MSPLAKGGIKEGYCTGLFIDYLRFYIARMHCAHKSEIAQPLVDIPSSYSKGSELPSSPAGKWWTQFEDEKLNSLMEEAFQYNLDIAQSYERLIQSQAVLRKVNASRWISVDVDASGGRSRQSGFFGGSSQAGGLGSVTFNTYSLSAAARYELDLWGKLKSNTRAAQYDVFASEQDLKSLFISISAQLADLYYLAAEQRAQIELTDETIASFQDTLDRVERRYHGGVVPALDVYQSRQNLASARAQKPVFESTLAVTLNAIAVLTGQFPDKEIGGNKTDLDDVPALNAGLPSQLLKRRPDVEAALMRLKASDERIGAAIADRFPSINLTGSYGGSSDEPHSVLDSPNIFWNLLVQIAQPVIDSGRRRAEVDRTESVFREDLAAYHKTVLTAFQEVEDALAKISASEERIRMLDETVTASDSALRLALDNYLQGLTDYLPVLTEQVRNATAKSNLITAKQQLISDRIQLARALGGEWPDDVLTEYVTLEHNGANNNE
jgi:NodT family efflux transporter outer membrane factor (OMF) lipoprotein